MLPGGGSVPSTWGCSMTFVSRSVSTPGKKLHRDGASELLGVSDSDISAIRRGKSFGLVRHERLVRLWNTLTSLPEEEA